MPTIPPVAAFTGEIGVIGEPINSLLGAVYVKFGGAIITAILIGESVKLVELVALIVY